MTTLEQATQDAPGPLGGAGRTGARHLRVAVIGAGMAGVLSAIKLREAGITDVVVYEKADRIGGTWRENTYPGVACDIPSHLYCYSFAPNPDWSRMFSPGDEIERYFEQVARDRGVLPLVAFGQEVTRCELEDGGWQLTTAAGRRDRFDAVIAATGVLHHPRLPDISGLDRFAGPVFHSARWDHDVPLEGVRLGLIGTGSTAIQIVSAAVGTVGHLSLFQRTPQWILPVENPSYSPDERTELHQHPEKLQELHDLFSDTFSQGFANAVVDASSPQLQLIEQLCRDNLEQQVVDPVLREKLRPSYRAACKRLIISGDFYRAIQSANAELVTEPIEGVEPDGVRTADGRLHPLDVLVLATGFKVDAFVRPMTVIGRQGVDLSRAWGRHPVAYLSVSVPEFPNFFMLNGPNGPVGNFSLVEVAELQVSYVLQLLDQLRSGACREICATKEATEQFEAARVEQAGQTVWVTGCRSWYLDDHGVPATWPWTFDRFRQVMRTPQAEAFERRG